MYDDPFGSRRKMLARVFAEDDRVQKEFDAWQTDFKLRQSRLVTKKAPVIHTADAAPEAPAPTEAMLPETYLSPDQLKDCRDLGLDEAKLRRMHPMSRELFLVLRRDKRREAVIKSAVGEHLPQEEHEQFFRWYARSKAVRQPGGLQYRTRLNARDKIS